MEPNKPLTMEETILDGSLVISKLLEESILILGNSRVGKSTLFTHLLNIPMKGSVDQNEETTLKTCYEEGVEVRDTYESVTLVPNVAEVKVNEVKVGLCDTAGFEDEGRSFVGVFGVSFLLDEILEKVRKPKFLLVIPHTKIIGAQVSELLKPFETFLRLINIDTLIQNETIQNKIIKSIAVVLIKSTYDIKRYKCGINKAITHLEGLGDQLSNERKICLKILKSIYDDSRIELFREAVGEEILERSTILQNLSKPETNWRAYDGEGFNHNLVFRLPIQDDFKILEAKRYKEIELYRNFSANKRVFLKKSYQILSGLVEKGIKYWYSKTAIDYDNEFKEIKRLIKDNPYKKYDPFKHLKIERLIKKKEGNKKGENSKDEPTRIVSRLNFLKSLRELEKKTIEFNEANVQEWNELEKVINVIEPCFETFDICRKTFCQTEDQENTFITFMFMNHRSLIENKIQIKIHPEENSGAIFPIMNVLTRIIPEPIAELEAKFIHGFVALGEEKKEFESLIKHTMRDMTDKPKQKNFVLKSSLKLAMSEAYLLFKSGDFIQSLEKFLEADTQFCEYLETLPEEDNRDEKTQDFVEFKKLEIYKQIALCLEGLNENGYALEIYEDMRATSQSMKCYKKMIAGSCNKMKKFYLMKDYASYLFSKGKKEALIEVYENIIDEFIYFPSEIREIKTKLANALESDFSSQLNDYVGELDRESMVKSREIIKKIKEELELMKESVEENEEEKDFDEYFAEMNSGNGEMEDEEQ